MWEGVGRANPLKLGLSLLRLSAGVSNTIFAFPKRTKTPQKS